MEFVSNCLEHQSLSVKIFIGPALAELVCHSALQMCTRNVQTNLVPLFSRALLNHVRKRSPIYLFAFVAVTPWRALISTVSYAGKIR
jgi:hypothetical protein